MQLHQMPNLGPNHLFEITTRIWFENSVEAWEKSPLAHPTSFAALSAPVYSVVSANAQAIRATSNV
jgi:hypothetical protein